MGIGGSSRWREQGQVGLGEDPWLLGLKWGRLGMDWGEVKGRPILDCQGFRAQSLYSMPQSLFQGFIKIVGGMLYCGSFSTKSQHPTRPNSMKT